MINLGMHKLLLNLLKISIVSLFAINFPLVGYANTASYKTNQATLKAAQAYENQLSIFQPVIASQGMVVSEQKLATDIGLDVLAKGGNAIDAAVATGFALAVVLPNAGNLGGGGFMLVHIAKDQQQYALDFRETAPLAASRDMYLNESGAVIPGKSIYSHQSVAVPGTVAGLSLALDKWGTQPLSKLIKPAENLARHGFVVSHDLANKLEKNRDSMGKWAQTRVIFWRNGEPLKVGETLVQDDLAESLKLIAQKGAREFYEGSIADKIAAEMQRRNGLITKDDLSRYQAKLREPIFGTYRSYSIATMPPPSSGGVHLVQMLNILENWDVQGWGASSAQYIHHAAEAMRLAYADRAKYLGDTDFVTVPVANLIDKNYAQTLANNIKSHKAKSSEQIKAGIYLTEGTNTTHFSIIDKDGNAVALTYTLNTNFGSGIVASGTGILLNNEMDDFSAKPGVANIYGLVGGAENAIEPGKRPLSSMTPTIVLKNNQPWLVTGSPGGSHIITTVLETIIDTVDFGMNPAQAAATPRFHHQWLPDQIRLEQGFSPDTIKLLEDYGHKIVVLPTMGKTQTILYDDGFMFGAADPRNPDSFAAGLN